MANTYDLNTRDVSSNLSGHGHNELIVMISIAFEEVFIIMMSDHHILEDLQFTMDPTIPLILSFVLLGLLICQLYTTVKSHKFTLPEDLWEEGNILCRFSGDLVITDTSSTYTLSFTRFTLPHGKLP